MGKIGDRSACKETEEDMGGDRWWWIDDNAKTLEVFIMPGVYEEHRSQADDMLDFVMHMSKEGLMLRRQSINMIVLKNRENEAFSAYNGIMDHYGNINNNEIATGYRFHDGRDQTVMNSFAGFHVTFDAGGKTYSTQDVPIESYQREVEKKLHSIVVRFALTYENMIEASVEYHISDDTTITRMFGTVKNIQDTRIENAIIVMKKGFNDNIQFRRICSKVEGADVSCSVVRAISELSGDKLDWFTLYQEGQMGYAYGFHTLLRHNQLRKVIFHHAEHRARSIEMHYGGDSGSVLEKDQVLSVEDRSLLTSGGLYKTMPYDELFKTIEDRKELTDFSISYDYGAELSSVASFAFFLKGNHYKLADNEREEAQRKGDMCNNWCLKHIDAYMANFVLNSDGEMDKEFKEIFLRGHSLVIVAMVKLLIMNKGNADVYNPLMLKLNVAVNMLQTMQIHKRGRDRGMFQCNSINGLYLDCHGAAMLAVTYLIAGYEHLELMVSKDTLVKKLSDAIDALRVHLRVNVVKESTGLIESCSTVSDHGANDGMMWNFKSGVFLRALNMLDEIVRDQGLWLSTEIEAKKMLVKYNAYASISSSIRDRTKRSKKKGNSKPYKECVTSFRSGETNSETQPWCMLGFFPEYEEAYYSYLHKR